MPSSILYIFYKYDALTRNSHEVSNFNEPLHIHEINKLI